MDETTKHFPSPKGAHLDSSHRNAQDTPDLMKLHSFDMTKDDHFSVLHGKPGERAVDRCLTLAPFHAIHRRFLIVGHLGHVWPFLMTEPGPGCATSFPQDVLTPIQRDTTHPGGEPRLPSKVSEGEVGLDEGVLRDVLGLHRISEHPGHEIMNQHLVALDQDGVSSPLAGQASSDDGLLIDGIGLEPGMAWHLAPRTPLLL